MKVVILAGGLGTRISEESRFRPKPMIEIGGKPILWHIMKCYSHYGYNEFIICAGYMQQCIKDWLSDFYLHNSDVAFDFTTGRLKTEVLETHCDKWKVTVVDTGLETMTGGRIRRIQKYVGNERFMLTYGDAVCNVNIAELVKFHESHGKKATLTAVRLNQEKGVLDIDEKNSVKSFREKSANDSALINAGFMVLEPDVFDLLEGDASVFEREPLERLSVNGELKSYVFDGFWQCMDSLREKELLEKMYKQGSAPWRIW